MGLQASDADRQMLKAYLSNHYSARSWHYSFDVRIGYNRSGTYVHTDHHKRYFGLPRHCGSVLLKRDNSVAVPLFDAPAVGRDVPADLLTKLANAVPTVSDDLRYDVLHGTFEISDENRNHVLSRPE